MSRALVGQRSGGEVKIVETRLIVNHAAKICGAENRICRVGILCVINKLVCAYRDAPYGDIGFTLVLVGIVVVSGKGFVPTRWLSFRDMDDAAKPLGVPANLFFD